MDSDIYFQTWENGWTQDLRMETHFMPGSSSLRAASEIRRSQSESSQAMIRLKTTENFALLTSEMTSARTPTIYKWFRIIIQHNTIAYIFQVIREMWLPGMISFHLVLNSLVYLHKSFLKHLRSLQRWMIVGRVLGINGARCFLRKRLSCCIGQRFRMLICLVSIFNVYVIGTNLLPEFVQASYYELSIQPRLPYLLCARWHPSKLSLSGHSHDGRA